MELLALVCIGLGICAVVWIVGKCRNASLYDKLKPRLDTLDAYKQELEQRNQKLDKKQETILLLAKQKATGFPYTGRCIICRILLECSPLCLAKLASTRRILSTT